MIAAVIISSLLSLVLFPGCGRNSEIKSIMQDMRASELAIPNDLQKIESRSISRVSPVRKDATLIIYYDSLTCSMCNINKLHQLDTLFGLEKTFPGFEVMVIFSPAPDRSAIRTNIFLETTDFTHFLSVLRAALFSLAAHTHRKICGNCS